MIGHANVTNMVKIWKTCYKYSTKHLIKCTYSVHNSSQCVFHLKALKYKCMAIHIIFNLQRVSKFIYTIYWHVRK